MDREALVATIYQTLTQLKTGSNDTTKVHSNALYIGMYAVWQSVGLASIVLCFWTSYTMMAAISASAYTDLLSEVSFTPHCISLQPRTLEFSQTFSLRI